MSSPNRRIYRSRCAIQSCGNTSLQSDRRSYFRFPKDEALCRKWVVACGRVEFERLTAEELYARYRICSDHFEDRMFVNGLRKKRLSNAVPTLFNLSNSSQKVNSSQKFLKRRVEVQEPQPAAKKLKLDPDDEMNSPGVPEMSSESVGLNSPVTNTPPHRSSKIPSGGSRCSVKGCNNTSAVTKNNPATVHIVYHALPKDLAFRKHWIASCGREKGWNRNNALICSEHFTPDDYEEARTFGPKSVRKKLKKTAFPTQKLGVDATVNNTDSYRWPVIDKVYAQWKDHSSPAPYEHYSPRQVTVEIKQEVEDPSEAEIDTEIKPCIVNLSWNNILAKNDSKEYLKIIRKQMEANIEKNVTQGPRQPEISPTRKQSTAGRKRSPAANKGRPTVNKGRPVLNKASPAVRKESKKLKASPSVRSLNRNASPVVKRLGQNSSPAKRRLGQNSSLAVRKVSQNPSITVKGSSPNASPAARRASQNASAVARRSSQNASPAARRPSQNASPAARRPSQNASPAARRSSQNASAVVRRASQNASPAARRASQNASPAVRRASQNASPAVRKEISAARKVSPGVRQTGHPARKVGPAVKRGKKVFEVKPDTLGASNTSQSVKLGGNVSKILPSPEQSGMYDQDTSRTVHSEEEVDNKPVGVDEMKLGGPVLCVNLGKPVVQGVHFQTSRTTPVAKPTFRRKFGASRYRHQRGSLSQRSSRMSPTQDNHRIPTIRVKPHSMLTSAAGSPQPDPGEQLLEKWQGASQMTFGSIDDNSEMAEKMESQTTDDSTRNSSEMFPDNIHTETTDDDNDDSRDMFQEYSASSTTDETENNETNADLDQERDFETEPAPKKFIFEGSESKQPVVVEKRQPKQRARRGGFVAPVRRTERVPVKKKFLGDFEDPTTRGRRSSLVRTAASETPTPPPSLPPTPSPVDRPSVVHVTASPAPVKNNVSVPTKPTVQVKTPSFVPMTASPAPVKTTLPVKQKASAKTPPLPLKPAAPIKTSSVPVKSSSLVKIPSLTTVRPTAVSKAPSTPVRVTDTPEKASALVASPPALDERCFVCDKLARSGVSVHRLTGSSKIHIHEKLDKILGVDKLTLKLEEDGVLCSRCSLLLNYVDRIEVELSMLNKAILNCMRPKCVDKRTGARPQSDIQELTSRSEEMSDVNAGLQSPDDKTGLEMPDDKTDVEKLASLPAKHVCRICRFKTPYQSLMIFHLRQHLKVNSYRCDFCNGQLQASEAAKCLKPRNRKKKSE